MFRLGFQVFSERVLPYQGMPISDTNASLPGSLQAIAAAVPLYFAGGHPFAEAVFIQLINAVTVLVIYRIYVRLFPPLQHIWFFAFLVLNPWSIVFSSAWNPSYIPLLAAIWLYGFVQLLQGGRTRKAYFCFLFPHLLIAQLNLQFFPLALFTFIVLATRVIPWPRFAYLFAAVLPGLITLLPWVLHVWGCYNPNLQSVEWGKNDSAVAGLSLNIKNIFEIFHVTLRGISFTAGIPLGSSVVPKALLREQPWLFLPFAIGSLGTLIIAISGIFFFIRRATYTARHSFVKKSLLEKLDLLIAVIFFLTGVLFVFSRADARAHRIWFLFPIAFYPVLRGFIALKDSKTFWTENRFALWFLSRWKPVLSAYLLASLIYTVFGATQVVFNFDQYDKAARVYCNGGRLDDVLRFFPTQYLPDNKLNADNLNLITYTTETLCPYYKNRQ